MAVQHIQPSLDRPLVCPLSLSNGFLPGKFLSAHLSELSLHWNETLSAASAVSFYSVCQICLNCSKASRAKNRAVTRN